MNVDIDIRHVLPAVRVPTLLLHSRNDRAIDFGAPQYMHRRICGSKGRAARHRPSAASGSTRAVVRHRVSNRPRWASSLGAAFGVAISAAIFTALSGDSSRANWLDGVITVNGRQDNLAVREAAIVALGFNVLMVVMAMISIMLTMPKGTKAP